MKTDFPTGSDSELENNVDKTLDEVEEGEISSAVLK